MTIYGRTEEDKPRLMPSSRSQQHLWLLAQRRLSSSAYNEPVTLYLDGELDVAALSRSLNEIIRRHEAWRTTFSVQHDELVQLIWPSREIQLPFIDLCYLPSVLREAEARRLATDEAQQPFDLGRGPLLRTTLIRLDDSVYRLFLTFHQVILDGVSLYRVFLSELVTLYDAFASGQASPFTTLPIQYSTFADWQRRSTQEDGNEGQSISQFQQPTSLPLKIQWSSIKPITGEQTQACEMHCLTLTRELTESLKLFSRREGVTLFMTLLSAFYVLLLHSTEQTDLLIGTPVDVRRRAEFQALLGYCLNTVGVHVDLAGNPGFHQVLQRVREALLNASSTFDVFYDDEMQQHDHGQRFQEADLRFQVMIVYEPAQPVNKLGWSLNQFDIEPGAARCDLHLTLEENKAGISCRFLYRTDIFDQATIKRMAEHFQDVLTTLVHAPDQPINAVPLLNQAESKELLSRWNYTATPFPEYACVQELFEEQVERTPEAVALVYNREVLTYRELNVRANQLAHFLRRFGVGPEVLVGIAVERSVEMVVGLLGILKAGGAYVPLDPTYPEERLAFMLEDAQVPVLLTQQRLLSSLPQHRAKVFCLDSDWQAIAKESSKEIDVAQVACADNLVYMIYTSGSTGRPKGVMNIHRAVVNRLYWMQQTYRLTAKDRVLQKTPFSFDVSVWEFFWPLMAGASLVVAEPGGHQDRKYLTRLIAEQHITTLHFVPSMLHLFLQESAIARCRDVRRVICSGESLPVSVVASFFDRLSARLFNLYGPTEAAIDVTAWECEKASASPVVPIGYPIANIQIHLLDAHLQPIAVGTTGELYIGGVGLARGYHRRADLTAELFLPNPFSAIPGSRLYKTGDVARYLADGCLEYLGRIDHQVKLRGHRIELGEIETILTSHPQVAQAVVIASENSVGDKSLIAYVVAREGLTPQSKELRLYLQEKLPDFMVPAIFVSLETLPLTPSGKIDRKSLPKPEQGQRSAGNKRVPGTRVEQALAQIWQELLAIEQIGIDDNFFELGGDSLLANQLVTRLLQTFQVELSLRNVFEAPDIIRLARLVEQGQTVDQDSAIEVLNRTTHSSFALSLAQQRLWFLDQFQSGAPVYNILIAYRLKGELNLSAITQSLKEVTRRHEILRAVFKVVDEQPVQTILPVQKLEIPLVNLETFPPDSREREVQLLAEREAKHVFDLAQGPLLKPLLIRLQTNEYVLFLTVHHIVIDGWSKPILYNELSTLYGAYVRQEPSPLAELPVQYVDFAHWQQMWLQDEVLDAEVAYWKQQLAGAPTLLRLPTDRPRPAVETFRGTCEPITIQLHLVEALKYLSQRNNATLFMTLLAAFQLLLAHISYQNDIVVGTDVANRTRIETEKLIGFFVNQLVLRTDVSGDQTFDTLLHKVREVVLEGYEHQIIPFDLLVQKLNPERFPDRAPLFQVKLVLQNIQIPQRSSLFTLDPLSLWVDNGTSQLDLLLALNETEAGLQGMWQYNTDLFYAQTIAKISHHFVLLLEAVTTRSSSTLEELHTVLTEADTQWKQAQQRHLALTRHQHFRSTHPKPVTVLTEKETQP